MIDIRLDYLKMVKDILKKHIPELEVWAFGSRVNRAAKKHSDLDLAVITEKPLSLTKIGEIKDDFSESDLPFRVDVVDWATTSSEFRKIIEKEFAVIQKGKK